MASGFLSVLVCKHCNKTLSKTHNFDPGLFGEWGVGSGENNNS
ncbi:hypothetical protein COO91_05908 [Nostoc flagelliforme CCNUN1]|uniref:Uncharacterized protein n=1 Tax=Nostoc flagelliforme CCNUN1 TaxID=2038116 RepID=A0A2K8SWT6_9NOSO|nr:hypothetical protein COO91_05908 [Nostoc flagelliforme CCNUN1]